MGPLSYDITEAMVQCFGRAFYYKDGVSAFFLAAGVERTLVEQYRDQPKFVWARKLLIDLGQSEDGCVTQRRVLTELCKLRDVPDKDVPDRNTALDALRHLKALAHEQQLIAKQEKDHSSNRNQLDAERQRLLAERRDRLDSLRERFLAAWKSTDRQSAGYALEDILVELFNLFEIEYRKSYRTPTQQIDGQFNFDGFHYLVEAKWRNTMPTEQDIGGFKHKVDGKLDSTRGFFVSIRGFRQEVIDQFNGRGANIVLMDGSHIIHVLEGRLDLRDLLKMLIDKAAQEGVVYTRLGAS